MKSRMKLLISFALFLALTNTAYAQEWKKVYPLNAKVELRTDWSWAARGLGSYSETWNDAYTVHLLTASWRDGTYPRIEVLVQQLAPQRYWRSVGEVNEKRLTSWNHLKTMGVSEIKKVPCDGLSCVAFKVNTANCVGFLYVDGTLGYGNEQQGSDLISGYYCAGPLEEIAPEQVTEILDSIVVTK